MSSAVKFLVNLLDGSGRVVKMWKANGQIEMDGQMDERTCLDLTMALFCSSKVLAWAILRKRRRFLFACCSLLCLSYSNWLWRRRSWPLRMLISSAGGTPTRSQQTIYIKWTLLPNSLDWSFSNSRVSGELLFLLCFVQQNRTGRRTLFNPCHAE